MNDATPDKSMIILNEILSQYPLRKSQTRILNHKINRGLSATRNTAVKYATGDFILHVDSDDWIEHNMAEKMFICANKSHADIVICGANYIYPNHIAIYNPQEYLEKDDLIKKILYKNIPGSMWGKLILRQIYNHRDVWSIEGINHGEDYATTPRILSYSKKIAYIYLNHYIIIISPTQILTQITYLKNLLLV